MIRTVLVITAIALMMSFALPAVSATTYYGPSLGAPVSIAPGNPIDIAMSVGSGTTIVPLPQGSSSSCVGTCVYPQQAWTSPTGCFTFVHQVTVTDPSGDQFMLGSSTTSGLNWPSSLGGGGSGTSYPPQAPAINFTSGDTFTLPFGSGPEGYTFTSVLSNPPNNVAPEGPYYWWVSVVGSGNPNGLTAGARLDTISYNPTLIHGTYEVDIEGAVACPTGSTTFTTNLFFDSGIIVTTPQFGSSIIAVAGIAFVVLMLARSGALGRRFKVQTQRSQG